jgi:transcriptional regulator GlxA family with amidase domain
MTTFHDAHVTAHSHLLGIRFKPGGMAAFMGLPMQVLTDQHLLGTELSLPLLKSLQEAIAQNNTLPEILRAISTCLLRALPVQHTRMQAAIDIIQSNHGSISPTALAAHINMSPRNFERAFLQHVGTSAKTFSRIVRCLSAKTAMQTQPVSNLLSLAINYGYHDHAHFTREFSQITGQRPSEYLSYLYK